MALDSNLIIYTAAAVIILLFVWIIVLEFRIRKFFRGKNGKSLESTFVDLVSKSDRVDEALQGLKKTVTHIDKRVTKNINKPSILRFNAFSDSGGNQSFVASFLDENGDGALISSMYGRENTSVYAKPVENYSSEYELSAEEQEVLKKIIEQRRTI